MDFGMNKMWTVLQKTLPYTPFCHFIKSELSGYNFHTAL